MAIRKEALECAAFVRLKTAYDDRKAVLKGWKDAGKKVELTTLHVTNWPDGEEVLADVLVYKKKVIGGAVYTASVDGFMQGLIPMDQSHQTS